MSDKKTEVCATHRPDQLHGERSLVVVGAQNLSPSFFFLVGVTTQLILDEYSQFGFLECAQ